MTEQDLRAMLREHVTATEPPFTLLPTEALTRGHLLRTRRRIGASSVGLVAAVTIGVAVAVPAWQRPPTAPGYEIAPATQTALETYEAREMPALMDDRIRAAVGNRLPLPDPLFMASGGSDVPLPERLWDKASSMTTTYIWPGERQLRVWIGHGKSYTEGGVCQEPTGTPTAFEITCESTTLSDGTVAETTVGAVYPDPTKGSAGWIALTPRNLESGKLPRWSLQMLPGTSREIDWDKVHFSRNVKAVHSETFLGVAGEAVQARSYDEALAMFALPVEVLTAIATDPTLVIPKPAGEENVENEPFYAGSVEAQLSQSLSLGLGYLEAQTMQGTPLPADRAAADAIFEQIGPGLPEGTRIGSYSHNDAGAVHLCLLHTAGRWAAQGSWENATKTGEDGRCPEVDLFP